MGSFYTYPIVLEGWAVAFDMFKLFYSVIFFTDPRVIGLEVTDICTGHSVDDRQHQHGAPSGERGTHLHCYSDQMTTGYGRLISDLC